jgi:triphosphoribosyl-dephospho-CoA synthase
LDDSDAANVFTAIAEANPGGLGTPAAGDVRTSPKLGLLEAMALAASRDRVARAYVTGFEDIFAFGLANWNAQLAAGHGRHEMVSNLFLAFLSAFPDSHIGRKYGPDVAEAVRAEAANLQAASQTANSAERTQLLLDFDRRLKARGLNPGTSADLTVATLFAAELLKIEETEGPPPELCQPPIVGNSLI